MTTIVTRAGKGSALSYSEMDANFNNLNADKIDVSAIANMLETTDVGSVVQAYSPNLTEFASVNPTPAGLALLDDADAAAQRTTLGLGTAATAATGDFATAAQGTKADTALQPANIGVSVQAYDVDTAKTDVAQNFTASQRSAPIVDNDLSFDLSGAGNNYTCSFSSSGTLTFTNITANSGKSGWIKFVVTGTPTVSAHANTKITAANLTRLGAAGTYVASYYCDGTDVYVSVGTYA